MTRSFSPSRLTTVLLLAGILSACQKENSATTLSPQEEQQAVSLSAESEAEADALFNDVFDNVLGVNSDVGLGDVGIFGRVATSSNARTDSNARCVNVSITPLQPGAFPKTVVMDFGSGCAGYGRLRSGKIITVYTGPLRNPGSTATTTFDNYRVDSVLVEGTHIITNTTATTPGNNQRQFKLEVKEGKLTRPNGNFSQWNSVRVQTQVEGNGSVIPADDIFRVTGSASGRVKHNTLLVEWSSEITEPLLKRFTCRWISKGIIKTTRRGLGANTPWVGILDFGDGSCDNKATLTINGNTQQITLR